MVRKFLQLQEQYLAGAGASIGATTIILKSFKQIDGTNITDMEEVFGDKAYATIEPGKGTREEQIVFTGISVNEDGTVSLTGVSSVTMDSPYTETPGLTKQHAGGVAFVITNTSGFYQDFMVPSNDTTITGEFEYTQFPKFITDTDLDEELDEPTEPGHFIHKEYLETVIEETETLIDAKVSKSGDTMTGDLDMDGNKVTGLADATEDDEAVNLSQLQEVVSTGTLDASETVAGKVEIATDAEALAGTDTGSTGAPLVVTPSQLLNVHADVQTFLADGTWTKPNKGKRVHVQAWGAGGSGGDRNQGSNVAEGGGGGMYIEGWFDIDDLGSTVLVTVAPQNVSTGTKGEDSSFGSHLIAYGGSGGGSSSGGAVPPAWGGSIGEIGCPVYGEGGYEAVTGDGLYSGASGSDSVYGGAGGGRHNEPGGTSVFGGNGGAGSQVDGVDAGDGEMPGGGGGGSRADSSRNGYGGAGMVIVTTI